MAGERHSYKGVIQSDTNLGQNFPDKFCGRYCHKIFCNILSMIEYFSTALTAATVSKTLQHLLISNSKSLPPPP